MSALFREIHRNRELVWALAMKDLTIRYQRSRLGALWALLHPALLMIILTLVFSSVMRFPIHDYAVFLISGLLPWMYLSQSLLFAADSIVLNAMLLRTGSVPKLVFPVAAVLANIVNLVISLLPLALLVLALGFPIHASWLVLPVPILALTVFATGAGLALATYNVIYRDVGQILQAGLSMGFYLTPVLYPLEIIPESYRWVFYLNPLYYLVEGFRAAVYVGHVAPLSTTGAAFFVAGVALWLGYGALRRREDGLIFYL